MNSESQHPGSSGESTPFIPPATVAIVKHELHHVRRHWCWFFSLGVLLLLGGILAIVFPALSSAAAIRVLSIVLMVAGVVTIVGSFWAGRWGGFLVNMLVGMLYLAASFVVSERPVFSLLMITAYLAITFMVMGLFRILAAMSARYPQWGWSLLNGGITFLLGLAIYRDLRDGALWIIGLLVGIELVFSGWAWIMLALDIRQIPD